MAAAAKANKGHAFWTSGLVEGLPVGMPDRGSYELTNKWKGVSKEFVDHVEKELEGFATFMRNLASHGTGKISLTCTSQLDSDAPKVEVIPGLSFADWEKGLDEWYDGVSKRVRRTHNAKITDKS